MDAFMRMFQSAKGLDFENCLTPIREMAQRSMVFNVALGQFDPFVREILKRIGGNEKGMVRFMLLKLIKLLYDEHPYPIDFATKFQLMLIIKGLVEDDEMVLVKEVASQLAKSLKMQLYWNAQP